MEFNDYQDNGRSGPPLSGAIFMANRDTKRECFKLKLFGLPPPQFNFVKKVKSGMILFLFEYEERKLYGVFQATSDGASNIVRNAFKSSGKQFPAQIRFKTIWHCKPLSERDFGDAIRDNYYTSNKFNQGLSYDQVSELLKLFKSRRIVISKSMSPSLRNNRSLSSDSGRIKVFEDEEYRASASGQSQTRRAIDKAFNSTTQPSLSRSYLNSSSGPDRSILSSDSSVLGSQLGLSSSDPYEDHRASGRSQTRLALDRLFDLSKNLGLSSSYLKPSSGPNRSILGSDSSILGSPQGLSSSECVNHSYGNLQSSLNSGEYYTNSPGNQATASRSRGLDEKSNLGEYIPLEDDPYASPSFGPGKDPPYVPEYVTPIPVPLRSDIPSRISVFDRLIERVNISQADDVLDDCISEDIDIDDDALLTTEEMECNDVVVEEPPITFNRRNKIRTIRDNIVTEESDGLSGNLPRKRRKILRPSFVKEETHEKGDTPSDFPNVEKSLCQEIIECKEKRTSETSVITDGSEANETVPSENIGLQTMVHPVYSEHKIDKTEFDEGKGRGETHEKEHCTEKTEFDDSKGGGEASEKEHSSDKTEFVEGKGGVEAHEKEHPTEKTEFDKGKGGGEATEKEPTPVRAVTEVSENADGSSDAKIGSISDSEDFKTRVEELVEELKGIQGSSATEQDATQNTQ